MQTEVMQKEASCVGGVGGSMARDSFFLTPPGLQLPEATESVRTTSGSREEDILGELCNDHEGQEAIKALREATLAEAEARVAAKVQELWARARQAMNHLQERHDEATAGLREELARCQERQVALQAENDALRQGIENLSARLSLVVPALGNEDVNSTVISAFAECSASPITSPVQATPELLAPGPFASPVGEVAHCSADCLWGPANLPELPPFPFPAQPLPAQPLPPPGTPLSLAEALGTDAPRQPAPRAFPEEVAPLVNGDFGFMMPEAEAGSVGRTSTLRADACVFVPRSAGPAAQ